MQLFTNACLFRKWMASISSGLRLALSLMLGHRRVLFLSGSVGRHGKRAGKQASRDDGE